MMVWELLLLLTHYVRGLQHTGPSLERSHSQPLSRRDVLGALTFTTAVTAVVAEPRFARAEDEFASLASVPLGTQGTGAELAKAPNATPSISEPPMETKLGCSAGGGWCGCG